MRMVFGEYIVDLDVQKTRAFYEHAEELTKSCQCQGCRNYGALSEQMPEKVRDFFQSIGVEISKPAEVYVNCKNEDGTLSYGGFYHICGTILEGKSAWVQTGTENEPGACYQVERNFQISFENKIHLLEEGFPEPVIQMEIYCELPWVLEEQCELV